MGQHQDPASGPARSIRCGSQALDLSSPIVMGVLNVTPDSFSDGGRWLEPAAAIARGLEMAERGAGMIDVGGESTRPGAERVSSDEEIRRVVPIIETLAKRLPLPVSVDTSRPAVIRAACNAGATFVNDVRALTEPGAIEAVASTSASVCLMHMQGDPRTMQVDPRYDNVVAEVRDYLRMRAASAMKAGIASDRIVLDPGIGFGKRLEHNLALLRELDALKDLGFPLLIGASRKSFIGALTGKPTSDRLPGSLAVATAAVLAGASIIRAHDVGATVDAVKVAAALGRMGEKR